MANINNENDGRERIKDVSKNDSRITVTYIVQSNESLGGGGFGEVFLVKKEIVGETDENKQPLYAIEMGLLLVNACIFLILQLVLQKTLVYEA